MDEAVRAALRDASRDGITGKAVTPFLLDRVLAATGGSSLAANLRLVRSNVRLAAEISIIWNERSVVPRAR